MRNMELKGIIIYEPFINFIIAYKTLYQPSIKFIKHINIYITIYKGL